MHDITDYLVPVRKDELNEDNGFTDGQLAKHIFLYEGDPVELNDMDIVIVGVNETRGTGPFNKDTDAPDQIRKQLYQLHYWHTDIRIADLGNICSGAELSDTYAAVKIVVGELIRLGKTVIILGGSHDLTLAQYEVYKDQGRVIEVTCIDALIDLRGDSSLRCENFLLDMLTEEPNLIRHYNHIGFQSYFVHPRMLETMDKLRFDCYRVGMAKDNIEEMEPVLRNTNLLSMDISAIRNSDAPANKLSTNGFSGEEACHLTRFAGMSNNLSSFGIYGYDPREDNDDLTAKQISQMIWYFIDGKNRSRQESLFEERNNFNEFHTRIAEVDTVFLQSKKTSRWWMQLPDKKYIACSHNDYISASHNEIPERWLRVQERG